MSQASAAIPRSPFFSRLVFRKARAPGLPKLTAQEQAVLRAIARAVKEIKSKTSGAAVTRALEAGDAAGAVNAIRWKVGEDFLASVLPKQYRSAYDVSGEAALRRLKMKISFDLVNPAAVDFASTPSAG